MSQAGWLRSAWPTHSAYLTLTSLRQCIALTRKPCAGRQGAPQLRAQVEVHEALAAARLPGQIGAALLAVEERLARAGRLDGAWMRYWRDAWRHNARTLPAAPHALSLLASLQARAPSRA